MMVIQNNRVLCLTALLVWAAPAVLANNVRDTKHNLAVAGPGDAMSRICIFCHTPHSSNPSTPLWNRKLPTMIYTPYSSTTLQSAPDQPTHASKLCLSCHDGTIALGRILHGGGPNAGGKITGSANLTTDLSDDHPISFVYDSGLAAEDRELLDPQLLSGTPVHLDRNNQLQCTTCHDPHYTPYPYFLVVDNQFSELCTTCHKKTGWEMGAHATSSATWNGADMDPWPHSDWVSVAANGCESCHASHSAGTPERLLNHPEEEDNCLVCHNGNVATKNIANELWKNSSHDVTAYQDIHDPTEDFRSMARHSECQDCHNPHAASGTAAVAPNASGALTGVAGVTLTGAEIESVNYQYELCFRCHGDNTNTPSPAIPRQIVQRNIRMKFQVDNPSAHPVAGPGRNSDVPSLRNPWTETSVLYCTDCHANDSGPGANGNGPKGPHGSTWPFLLEREYRTADFTPQTYQAYAMCYKCHDEQNILDDQSFAEHDKHIRGEDTPCSVCHDPHGISATQGNSTNNSHLINFDTSIVKPDPKTGLLLFEDLGDNRGQCYLTCHGEDHSPETYGF